MCPGVRLVMEDPEDVPLTILACRMAFWSLTMTMSVLIAGILGVDVSGCTSLFEVLMALCRALTKESDEVILTWLRRRLSTSEMDPECAEAILEIDEVSANLEQDEVRDLGRLKREHESARGEAGLFRK